MATPAFPPAGVAPFAALLAASSHDTVMMALQPGHDGPTARP